MTELIYGICRFTNINGVTCYINSILHILQQAPIFADYIFSGSFGKIIREKEVDNEEKIKQYVCYELFKLFSTSMSKDDFSIKPSSFRDCIGRKNSRWIKNEHQDSQEFLQFLISKLEEEIGQKMEFIPGRLDVKKNISDFMAEMAWKNFQANEYSPLKEIFNGMTIIKTKCNFCSNTSSNYEPFTNLQLSIPIQDISTDRFKEFSLKDCFEFMMKEEQLDKDNAYKCSLCGFKNRSYKTFLLWRTPKILIIQFKRFLVNNYGIKTQKLVNQITYPVYDLDLADYIDNDSPFKTKSKYNLMGINLHQEFGVGINAGHYTSIVKNRLDDNWYLFDDESKPILAERMEQLQQRNAYLLFYYRDD